MVDIASRSELPGGTRGKEATGYFIANRASKPTEEAADHGPGMLLHALKVEVRKPMAVTATVSVSKQLNYV
jgi:hypothetical protein